MRSAWIRRFVFVGVVVGLAAGSALSLEIGAAGLAMRRATILRARIHSERGEWPQAERELRSILTSAPGDDEIALDLARVCVRTGGTVEAEQLFRRVIDRSAGNPQARKELASLLAAQRRDTEIVALLEPLVVAGPVQDPEIVLVLADAYGRTGNPARAERLYRAVTEKPTRDVGALMIIANHFLYGGDYERARPQFEKVLAIEPQNYRALKGLALSLQAANPVRSREILHALHDRDTQDFEVPFQLGDLYWVGAQETARDHYRESLRRLATWPELGAYELTVKARALHRLGEAPAAEEIYKSLLARNPLDRDVRNDYAELLIDLKRYDEALELLKPLP